ncbi:hypothetical protein DID78_04380 [Candidatus Marinamargulisbacteria bacterium SCGC AG-343-D04]|nr:hypothetical protein DID78_04380 [Candidatus Marinamargulisbacteria bacterium SCGC AG-343-D04]
MSPFKPLGDQLKIDKNVQQDLVRSQLVLKQWPTIVGDMLAKQLIFSFIRGETCVISTLNPCWYSEIKLFEQEIIKKINTALDRKKKIKHIKIVQQ